MCRGIHLTLTSELRRLLTETLDIRVRRRISCSGRQSAALLIVRRASDNLIDARTRVCDTISQG